MHNTSLTTADRTIDADLVCVDDVIRIPGERRRYRVAAVSLVARFTPRNVTLAEDERSGIRMKLVPVSRGGSAREVTLKRSATVLDYSWGF